MDAFGRPKPINVFFGPEKYVVLSGEKRYAVMRMSVTVFNTLVLALFSAVTFGILHVSLKRQLRTRGAAAPKALAAA